MNKKMILIPAMAMSLIVSPLSFAAKYDQKDDKQCSCVKMEKMGKMLNLTDDQKAKIKKIKMEAKEQLKSQYEKMKPIRKELHQLVTSDKMDEAKLNELINKKNAIKAETMKIKYNMKNKVYNVLDEKQKQQYTEMMKKWQDKWQDKMDKEDKDEMGDD